MNKFDLAIIGGGPVGLFATQFAQLHNLNTITFEALNRFGGQVEWLFPNKEIKDIPSYESLSGKDLIKKLKTPLTNTLQPNYRVETIKKEDGYFFINDEYQAKTILITTGLGAFHPKTLPIKVTKTEEKFINYFMTDPTNYKNQKVAVLGGGDTALDWALQLAPMVNSLTLIHRRPQFRGLESSLNQLKCLSNVKISTPYLPKGLQIKDNLLELTLNKIGSNEQSKQSFDNIFVAYGFKSDNRILRNWGLELSGRGIQVDRTMATNIPGIYAIGDSVEYEGRVPMIALGFGEAQIAITNIMAKLFPDKKITLHSTSI